MTSERVVLLVGSPKGLAAGNSARLGHLITDGLEAAGWTCDAYHLHAAVKREELMTSLLASIESASLILLSMPLYVDSLPAPVIEALDRIVLHRRQVGGDHVPRFLPILNCGFVEPWQNETAQRMLESFSRQARLEQVGALSLGTSGRMHRHVRSAFKLVMEALRDEILVPDEVGKLTQYRVMPTWLYLLGGNAMWRRAAKANGVEDKLDARPYERV